METILQKSRELQKTRHHWLEKGSRGVSSKVADRNHSHTTLQKSQNAQALESYLGWMALNLRRGSRSLTFLLKTRGCASLGMLLTTLR